MSKKILWLGAVTAWLLVLPAPRASQGEYKYFVGSSGFVLFNLIPNQDEPPDFYQINVGYYMSPQDVLSLEAITWRYSSPLGIPYGDDYEKVSNRYPGYVREYGISLVYQRFIWQGLYTAVHAGNFYQNFFTAEGRSQGDGYQLFLTLRFGYQFRFFEDRFFIEPSLAATAWPLRSRSPTGFYNEEQKWPNYFLFEPGLHFGYRF